MNQGRNPTPQKPDNDDEEKRREQMQRQMRFSLGYIITALMALWLFQEFILAPLLSQQARQLDPTASSGRSWPRARSSA